MPEIQLIAETLAPKVELILDLEGIQVSLKYSRGGLSIAGFNAIAAAIQDGESMTTEKAVECLIAFSVEWDITQNGVTVPTTQEGIETIPMVIIWRILNGVMTDFFQVGKHSNDSASGSKENEGGAKRRRGKRSAS